MSLQPFTVLIAITSKLMLASTIRLFLFNKKPIIVIFITSRNYILSNEYDINKMTYCKYQKLSQLGI